MPPVVLIREAIERGSSDIRGGLATMNAPSGTLIAFATGPGTLAKDGLGKRHSPFTEALLAEIQRPQTVESLFKQVRIRVHNGTGRVQTPWLTSSLVGEFGFVGGKAASSGTLASVASPPPPTVSQYRFSPTIPRVKRGECYAKFFGPAKYEIRNKLELVQEKPPLYKNVERRVLVAPGRMVWARVLCNDCVNQDNMVKIQRALTKAGYYSGPISGKLDEKTGHAVKLAQNARGISEGVLTFELLVSLGVDPLLLKPTTR